MLTRMHFKALAEALLEAEREVAANYPGNVLDARNGIELVRKELIRVCKGSNPNFNEERFRAASTVNGGGAA